MSRQIVNTIKNKDFISNILDKFLFSNLATFIVVFLGPLLVNHNFFSLQYNRGVIKTRTIVGNNCIRFFIYIYCRDINLAQSLKSICEPKSWRRRVYTSS